MAISVYNTMRRRKEPLSTRDEGRVAIYVCGPTVYNFIHIGNARTFITFDVVRRYLEHSGYDVTFVQNITDIDDKIINRANEEGRTTAELADEYREAFEEDMMALGIKPPTVAPRATAHIPQMLELVGALVDSGYAYESGGDVYFEVARYGDYGKLSGRNLAEQRVTVQSESELERKRDALDFALWKAAKPGEPSWDSPWGPGRPGWHIECSAMSLEYLGDSFDIHGGGQDLIFPHHENEIAQAEAGRSRGFARYWMHSGMLNIDAEKMSKSLGNIRRLRDVLTEYDADTIRMLMLGTHYRSPLSFSDTSLEEAGASMERIDNCLFALKDAIKSATDEAADGGLAAIAAAAEVSFREAMDDDFNTAAALGAIFGLVRDANARLADLQSGGEATRAEMASACDSISSMCRALGLLETTAAGAGQGPDVAGLKKLIDEALKALPDYQVPADEGDPGRLIDHLLEMRMLARKEKKFEPADAIRDGLDALDVKVEDTREGFRWRYER
jgi:cysteinyl-tRNA synthetase